MDGTGRETECKLDLAAGAALTDIPGWTTEHGGTVQLRTVYWDTADRRLGRVGHALRHRTTDGGSPHWNLKTTRQQHANLAVRDEHDEPGGIGRRPPRLMHALQAVVGEAPLMRIATIDVQRAITMLHRGDATIEMAEDRVDSTLGRRRGPSFHELELELVRGTETDLASAHDALLSLGATPSAWTSKLR
jgi:inorganic triphosphatase YgiF